jgi:chemotaxis protein CheX
MHEALAIEAVQSAATRVFTTMLGMELNLLPPFEERADPVPSEGVFAQISLVGACSITTLVNCSAEVACSIASAMLMSECGSVDAEVLDAMAEIANMIMGNVKTDLDTQLGSGNLSIPTVIFGRNFTVYNNSKRWTVVPFQTDANSGFSVKVCFEPAEEKAVVRRVEQVCHS